jgi:UDP-GlcNAc:undecaprenyl-phosphate/decaprenyl-phosphate GlcNAc-1-phosphate transferase
MSCICACKRTEMEPACGPLSPHKPRQASVRWNTLVNFPFNTYLLAFLGAMMATAASLPLWRAWCLQTGLIDDPGHRKIHHTPIPLAGGLAVFSGMAVVVVASVAVLQLGLLNPEAAGKLSHGLDRRSGQLAAILGGALGMVFLGWWDDRHELRPLQKFLGQLAIAGIVAASGVRVTLFVHSTPFSYGITILWITTVTNALNFNDNMNGLCGGLGVIASGWFGVIAAHHGQYLVASLALLVCGALLGFLPFNFPKASVFLGDSGSHLVGYLLSILAILPHFYSARMPESHPWAVFTPVLILGVPLLDLAGVTWRRTLSGKPFWVGDTNHWSHRLVRAGFSRTQAVACLWGISLVLGGVAYLIQ